MSRGTITSSPLAANEAVAELTHVQTSSFKNAQVSLGQSNLSSMQNGANVANQMISDLEALVAAVLTQANKFPQIAAQLEAQDAQIARNMMNK
ncbi:MAG: hypothetical protein LBI13_07570 [Streptococcaceae bacterium]|jgi:hypothetical protein|nr:hypothetical protein [Streptococcaceae bacterium]